MRNRIERPNMPNPIDLEADTPPAIRCAARAAVIDRLAADLAFIRHAIAIERRGNDEPTTYGRTPRPIYCSFSTHKFLMRWHDAYIEARPTLDERAFILLRR